MAACYSELYEEGESSIHLKVLNCNEINDLLGINSSVHSLSQCVCCLVD